MEAFEVPSAVSGSSWTPGRAEVTSDGEGLVLLSPVPRLIRLLKLSSTFCWFSSRLRRLVVGERLTRKLTASGLELERPRRCRKVYAGKPVELGTDQKHSRHLATIWVRRVHCHLLSEGRNWSPTDYADLLGAGQGIWAAASKNSWLTQII